MGMLNQIICTFIAIFLFFILGQAMVWPSSVIRLFESENTTLERPMGQTEISLLGSLSSFGGLIGIPLMGMSMDVIGRKYCAIAAGLITTLAWIIVASCVKVEAILLAVFLMGIGAAYFLVGTVFVGEICQDSIRGTMTLSTMLFHFMGMLASYILGGYLEYYLSVYTFLSLTALGTVMLIFLKETPVYMMKKGLHKEAQQSFAFYRNAAFDSNIVLQEMETLRRAFNPVMDDDEKTKTPEERCLNVVEQKKPEKLSLIRFIRNSRSTRRAIIITLILVTLSIFQGFVVLQINAEPLFHEAVPNMSSIQGSALLALAMIVASLISCYMIEICGRLPLIIYASLGSGLCCVLLATQIHLQWGPQWMTAALIYLYAIIYNVGPGTVPFVLYVEVFLPEVKSFMTMIVLQWAFLSSFFVLFIFNHLVTLIGLGQVFYVFAVVCVLTAVFSMIYVPETKSMAVDEIQNALIKRPRRNVRR